MTLIYFCRSGKPLNVSHLITYKTSKGFSSANEGGLKNERHCKNKGPDGLWTHPLTYEMDIFCGKNLLWF